MHKLTGLHVTGGHDVRRYYILPHPAKKPGLADAMADQWGNAALHQEE